MWGCLRRILYSSLRRIATTNRADTHRPYVQFCGNLPLFNNRINTQDYIPQRTKTAVDPRVGVPTLFASPTASVTPPQDDYITNWKVKERTGTTGTTGTTERIVDTQFRCCLFRLVCLCGLKKTPLAPQPNFLGESAVEWVTMGYYRLLWVERYHQ